MEKNKYIYDRLVDLFSTVKYEDFLQKSKANVKQQQWIKGRFGLYSVLPFNMELNGLKRGKVLKNEPKNKKNCSVSQVDQFENVLSEKQFCCYYSDVNSWSVESNFFQYASEENLQYSFEACCSDEIEVDLLTLFLVLKSEGLPISGHRYSAPDYHEYFYSYDEYNRIVKIQIIFWSILSGRNEPHTQEYFVKYDNDNVCLTLQGEGDEEIIYNEPVTNLLLLTNWTGKQFTLV